MWLHELMLGVGLVMAIDIAATQPFDREARISEAITKVRAIAMNADKVDWTAVEHEALRRTEGAKDTVDLLPGYYLIVRSLGDHHSNMMPPKPVYETWMSRYRERRYLPDTPRVAQPTSRFMSRSPQPARRLPITGGAFAVAVTVTASNLPDENHRYADQIYEGVVANPGCGFVIDLRGNTGGNTFPMLSGLSPLLGEGFRMQVPAARGQPQSYMLLKEGVAQGHMEGNPMVIPLAGVSHWRPAPTLAEAPAAVLIDDATASAGEGVAVAFRGRSATRFFGTRTMGEASGNEIVVLSDGVVLTVTEALLVDRDGETYPDGIEPDVRVTASATEDEAAAAAINWLRSQPACASNGGR